MARELFAKKMFQPESREYLALTATPETPSALIISFRGKTNILPSHPWWLKLLRIVNENPRGSNRLIAARAGVSEGKASTWLRFGLKTGIIAKDSFVRAKCSYSLTKPGKSMHQFAPYLGRKR